MLYAVVVLLSVIKLLGNSESTQQCQGSLQRCGATGWTRLIAFVQFMLFVADEDEVLPLSQCSRRQDADFRASCFQTVTKSFGEFFREFDESDFTTTR